MFPWVGKFQVEDIKPAKCAHEINHAVIWMPRDVLSLGKKPGSAS